MENKIIKCSSKKHNSIDAINFCQECNIYMCNKCQILHSELFDTDIHKIININKDTGELFTGFCNEEGHKNKLEYYCKNHNIFCCAACLSIIDSKGNGKHKNCNVFNIEDIKDEKKNKLKDNIKYLEDLSKTLEQSINKLKEIYEKISKNKEDLKLNIQKIFTKIRNTLNEREDKILAKVDNEFDNIYFNEDLINKSEKLPNKVNKSLEKGKSIENDWNENVKLNSLINDCIFIENNIKYINVIKEKLTKYNSIKIEINFDEKENNVNSFLESIKSFGKIKIKEEEDIDKFIRIIKEKIDDYKYKNINTKLVYDANKDGQNYSHCHSKVNMVPNTISIITTNNNKKFGLFRSIPINGSGPWCADNKAFFISFDKCKIYHMKKDTSAIAFDNGCFIQTMCFTLSGNILSDNYSCPGKDAMNQYFEGFTENYELTCGDNNFKVSKFEVFKLEFDEE